jgi:hypothetical protein
MKTRYVRYDYVDLPIDICSLAIKEKLNLELRLFLYWKFISSGHLKANSKMMEETSKDLGNSVAQIYVARKWLLENGWITYNANRKSIRLRRFDQIKKLYNLTSSAIVRVQMKDLKTIKGFLGATVITYWGKFYTGKRGQSAPDQNGRGCSSKSDRAPASHFICPHVLIMDKLNLPLSSAHHLREKAVNAGYLKIERDFERLPFAPEAVHLVRKYSDSPNRVRIINNMVCHEKSSWIWSNIILRKIRIRDQVYKKN